MPKRIIYDKFVLLLFAKKKIVTDCIDPETFQTPKRTNVTILLQQSRFENRSQYLKYTDSSEQQKEIIITAQLVMDVVLHC